MRGDRPDDRQDGARGHLGYAAGDASTSGTVSVAEAESKDLGAAAERRWSSALPPRLPAVD